MSSQTFEILCPVCRSVVPPEAKGCPTCARAKASGTPNGDTATAIQPAPPRHTPPDLRALPMRDYHRVVRATYQATEPTASGNRLRAYLPFVVLLLLLIVGAAMLYSHI